MRLHDEQQKIPELQPLHLMASAIAEQHFHAHDCFLFIVHLGFPFITDQAEDLNNVFILWTKILNC